LRKNDLKIRLQEQPFQILIALLDRPGEIVLREEIRQKLWPNDTVVEFDHSINAAVKRLRDALCDSAEKPRYIETLARRGYRFIGKLEPPLSKTADLPIRQPEVLDPGSQSVPSPLQQVAQPKHQNRRLVAAALAIIVLAAAIFVTFRRNSKVPSTPEMTRLTFDSGLTTDPAVSPDGKLMAYATDRNGNGPLHIWVQQFMPDGQAVQLTRGDVDDHQPAFSPDGSKVAFRSERDGGGIYVMLGHWRRGNPNRKRRS
jgi:DNA-binding winged helix-turn-helix (wHTH) protein